MKKLLPILALSVLLGCGNGGSSSPSAKPTPAPEPTVYVVDSAPDTVIGNISFTRAGVIAYIPVLQKQMENVAAWWGQSNNAKIIYSDTAGNLPSTAYVLTFKPGYTCAGCGDSYHSVDNNGHAYADVYVLSELNSLVNPLLASSHEVTEMVHDPSQNGVEIVDPVVCWTYCAFEAVIPGMLECGEDGSTETNGDIVADFVLPSWTSSTGKAPFDFMGLLTAPGQICN